MNHTHTSKLITNFLAWFVGVASNMAQGLVGGCGLGPGRVSENIAAYGSDAEENGLKHAVGKELVENLLKGCKVHWNRSCQRST